MPMENPWRLRPTPKQEHLRQYKLHKLYVLPEHHGKGAGKKVLHHIVADIQSPDGAILLVNVNRFNYQAISFYRKTGFAHFHDEDIDIGEGYFMNDHVLSLSI